MTARFWLIGLLLTGLSGTVSAQNAVTYNYDARGRLVGVTNGSGVKSSYSLDHADNRTNLTTQLQFPTFWQAQSLPHLIGYADSGAWAADVSISPNFLTYGPYTQSVPVGSRVGTWRMLIDVSNVSDNSTIAMLDVYDSTAGQELASVNITRHQWVAGYAYQVFELSFTLDSSRAGHAIELRTYYYGYAYLRVEKIGYY